MLKIHPPEKIILKTLIIITAVFLLTFLTIQISYAEQPEVQVIRSAAVINYDPGDLSQEFKTMDGFSDYQQKNMVFKWQQLAEAEENLRINLKSDLKLVSANSNKNGFQFGFNRFNEKNTSEIPAAAVLVKKMGNDSNYQPLDQSREVLTTENHEARLKFKIDESKLAANWQNLPAGTYKAELESSNYEFKNNPRVQVNVKEHLEIKLSDKNLELEIEDPTLGSDPQQYRDSLSWQVNSNTPVNVKFVSMGGSEYKSLTESEAKNFFRYVIKNGDINKQEHFSPAEAKTVNFSHGELEVLYSTDFEKEEGLFANQKEKKEWHQLSAGKYQDTIKITVEAQ